MSDEELRALAKDALVNASDVEFIDVVDMLFESDLYGTVPDEELEDIARIVHDLTLRARVTITWGAQDD